MRIIKEEHETSTTQIDKVEDKQMEERCKIKSVKSKMETLKKIMAKLEEGDTHLKSEFKKPKALIGSRK